MGLEIPPSNINTMLESNPLKSIMLVRRLAVVATTHEEFTRLAETRLAQNSLHYFKVA